MQDAEGRFTEQSFDVSDVTHDGLATADVTGDSREDVVVAASHNTPYSRLKVFPQLPQGGISPNPIVYDSYDLPESLSALDMTGDGREDVVVLHDGWMRIGVYEQSATGGLGPEQLFPKRYAGNYPYPDLRLADLDADARPDIAVMDQLGVFIMRRLPPPATPYVRPKGASPLRLPLVPSYQECRSSNAHHGPPLAFASCSPDAPESAFLTLGTPDGNGKPANGRGWIRIAAALGDAGTPENEADMRIDMSVSDVRNKAGLSDYEGELYEAMTFRFTDGDSRQAGEQDSGTGQDMFFAISAPCAPTGDDSQGSTCSLFTTLNTVIPGAVSEGNRAIWEVSKLEVYDGGADGVGVSEDDNTPFLAPGIFVP
jgi:hypothetical protein